MKHAIYVTVGRPDSGPGMLGIIDGIMELPHNPIFGTVFVCAERALNSEEFWAWKRSTVEPLNKEITPPRIREIVIPESIEGNKVFINPQYGYEWHFRVTYLYSPEEAE